MKLIFTVLIVYLLYRFFFTPSALNRGAENRQERIRPEEPPTPEKQADEGEYIDYEEVD
ncbi:MAG: hypothetical protein KDC66_10680 [Phaeodactylibacter sp.]|nr:hypothetical protein [Phaeodactylibacter sp.]MCB9272722.1 hypothetical protein [Lewinellaceae bacterium]